MKQTETAKRSRFTGTWYGLASILASAASIGSFALYARWHGGLVDLHRAGQSVPAWRRTLTESMKLSNVALALVAVILLFLALRRRSWVVSLFALAAAAFCLWTVPLIV